MSLSARSIKIKWLDKNKKKHLFTLSVSFNLQLNFILKCYTYFTIFSLLAMIFTIFFIFTRIILLIYKSIDFLTTHTYYKFIFALRKK